MSYEDTPKRKAWVKAYRAQPGYKERKALLAKKWRLKNLVKIKEYKKNNLDKIRVYRRRYYQKNKERLREIYRKYYERTKDRKMAWNKKHREKYKSRYLEVEQMRYFKQTYGKEFGTILCELHRMTVKMNVQIKERK